jgi:hypothetical protein
MRINAARVLVFVAAFALLNAAPGLGAFAGTELLLPAAGRVSGANGSEFYTTVWISNPTDHPVDVQLQFLTAGQSNPNPPTVTETIAAGEARTYDNIAESLFHLSGVLGAIRFHASDRLLVASRIYNQLPGDSLDDTQGAYFAAVPLSFAIGTGEQARLLGISDNSDFRYNLIMVESSGQQVTARVDLQDAAGATLATRDYTLRPWEQLLVHASDLAPGGAITNGQLRATVVSESGKLLMAGSLVANGSQDSTGFEMSFRDSLLTTDMPVVTSLNGLTGAVTLAAGPNISIATSGNTLTISGSGGGGATGPVGPQGPVGPRGATGPAGTPGLNGATGPIGPTGLAGATGRYWLSWANGGDRQHRRDGGDWSDRTHWIYGVPWIHRTDGIHGTDWRHRRNWFDRRDWGDRSNWFSSERGNHPLFHRNHPFRGDHGIGSTPPHGIRQLHGRNN